MNILLLYPKFPDTFWSFKHALKFIAKKSANIPLGIITVASLLPKEWDKKLIDLNVTKLKESHILWADYVFISGLSVQKESVKEIIKLCKQHKKKIVAGGPLFTEEHEKYAEIDYLVLNEAEITLVPFIEDLINGTPQKIYRSDKFADLKQSPIPDYALLNLKKYATAGIQYSRGCPYDCEFCDITALFGHKFRTKSTSQVVNELEALKALGWKGNVFFVDDNFIGNKHQLKNSLLPAMIRWGKQNHYQFVYTTEASIELSDDAELMKLMVDAGFATVFVGIETPEDNSLKECNKVHNFKRDLMKSVRVIQQSGMEVTAGFIVGFDNDTPNTFQKQIDFIQKSGIITAMVGLLNAPRLSKLYNRLNNEGRITGAASGDNTDYSINFEPAMGKEDLFKGYKRIVSEIYNSKSFYQRARSFLKHYDPPHKEYNKISFVRLIALIKSILFIGVLNRGRFYYWSFLAWSLFKKPNTFPLAVTYSIFGYHFKKIFQIR